MELHRYDIVEAEIKMAQLSGSVQTKKRPYVIIGNDKGTVVSPVVIAMPLTTKVKKTNLPTHGCIEANCNNGLKTFSMILGEQPCTLDKKTEITRKLGTIKNQENKDLVNKICWNTLFYGENINWEEVLK